ncbi:hypothetical protein FACS1894218_3500 [Bacilli bacterium]|nr:hypothetical protein FACS1894218_3500 [Bacilli bacterium]
MGALNPHVTFADLQDGNLKGDFINVNSIINPASVFYIAIYILVLLTVLKHGVKGIIKLHTIE